MADVRSMLRASREARRITHPNASYTSDGKLVCNLCETIVKTEASWQSHLHSSSHTLRASRANETTVIRSASGNTRKRKASVSESPTIGDRKKSKPTFSPGVDDRDVAIGQGSQEQTEPPIEGINRYATTMAEKQQWPAVDETAADPEAMEALERELADLEAAHRQEFAAQSGITISAAPMTAEEIAAQAREEQSTQREKRAAELEAEKEDATKLLEDEFDEMQGLEERVKKLREKREALRKGSAGAEYIERPNVTPTEPNPIAEVIVEEADEEEGDDDEEDDDDDDSWQFGAR